LDRSRAPATTDSTGGVKPEDVMDGVDTCRNGKRVRNCENII
jgi:hypothetical protein